MDLSMLVVVFSLLLTTDHVISFTISSRHERSTDLADALAILQRQRRRAGHVDVGRGLGSRPLSIDDVTDWLSRSRERDPQDDVYIDPLWVSEGSFKEFDPRGNYLLPSDNLPAQPLSVEPSRKELEDIFSSEDSPKVKPAFDDLPEKKKKEEMLEVKGDKKIVQKKSVGTEMSAIVSAANAMIKEDDDNISLDSLTKEEFKTLMKAVSKLQKQASKISDKKADGEEKVTIIEKVEKEPTQVVSVVQPASNDELKTVFEETVKPIVKETDVIVESPKGTKTEQFIEEDLVPTGGQAESKEIKEAEKELSNALATELEAEITEEAMKESIEAEKQELEDEFNDKNIATLERYWVMNKYLGNNERKKRTVKRESDSMNQLPIKVLGVNDIGRSYDKDGVFDVEPSAPHIDVFVAKILELQDEVDRLKMVAKLEDLENDVLTDALNEATLAQKEGSVSDTEFESLQQAIRIEEALQDLKNSADFLGEEPTMAKRGEPWKRQKKDDDDELIPPIGKKLTKADIEQLLGEQYLVKETDDDTDPAIASLFVKNADECPAVQAYSTNCELADLYSLPVDTEARSLCNIHEMCYACGHSLGVSRDHCDNVYRAAATALCLKKENCVLEAEIFLRTMKLKNRYVPHPQPQCRSSCTARFLGML